MKWPKKCHFVPHPCFSQKHNARDNVRNVPRMDFYSIKSRSGTKCHFVPRPCFSQKPHAWKYLYYIIYIFLYSQYRSSLGWWYKMPFCTTQIFQPGRPQEWWFFGDLCYTFWKALHEDLRHQAPEMEHLEIEPSDANNYTDTMDEILITGADVWK